MASPWLYYIYLWSALPASPTSIRKVDYTILDVVFSNLPGNSVLHGILENSNTPLIQQKKHPPTHEQHGHNLPSIEPLRKWNKRYGIFISEDSIDFHGISVKCA